MTLSVYNTLTRKKEAFKPIDAANVRMYVCGPTVYDRPHLGNARSVVVYDVLYRLLQHLYGKEHVTYVRNITDVDDKINAAAKANGEPISHLTQRVEGWFHDDMAALNVLPATHTLNGDENLDHIVGIMGEPHATHHVPHMINLIEKLIDNHHAYVSQHHVLFDVTSFKDYGALSGRKLDDLIAGARIEVESYKRHPGDFVLWKPAEPEDDLSSVFDSPWGKGRPGWHIECSAMSTTYLGANFDIHGGGADLMFPHHENEIAQSRCALPGSKFANYWVHNGFLTVNGEKMSKSLGNFITVRDLLSKGVKGEVIRYALLSAKYNEPLDWSEKLLEDSKKQLDYFYRAIRKAKLDDFDHQLHPQYELDKQDLIKILGEDLNIPELRSFLNHFANSVFEQAKLPQLTNSNDLELRSRDYQAAKLKYFGSIIGILQQPPNEWFKGDGDDSAEIQTLIDARIAAKKAKNWAEADRIRRELSDQGIILEDRPDGTTDWRRA